MIEEPLSFSLKRCPKGGVVKWILEINEIM
jgi:hypothetical protein